MIHCQKMWFPAALSAFALYLNSVDASVPIVDFSLMGTVGLAGAFAGLTPSQNFTAVTLNPSASTLLSRTATGAISYISSTNPGGSISSGCALNDVLYIAGSFSSVGNVSAENIASYAPSTGTFAALGTNGPNGKINTIYCDATNNSVWVGGQFSSPGSLVAVWNVETSMWSAPPFVGFAGAGGTVLSITSNSSQSSLFFAGSFITSFQGNETFSNSTNNPNVPYSAGATPFSSSLVPLSLQDAEIEGSPSSTDPNFSNIQSILCPAGPDGPGNTWLAADSNAALINILDFSSLSAYGVRLGNTFLSGYGTTGFSVTSIPDNTVQMLQYVDPQTGQNLTCTSVCPLSTNSSLLYQDFVFTSPITLTGIQITLSEWTGSAPGLHLLQLLSSGSFASAIESQNTQSCYASYPSNVTSTGTWTEKNATTDIPATLQSVLVANVAVDTPPSQAPSFTWMPYVSAAGEYTVNLVVPGCDDFQDCALRTSVQVTVFPSAGQSPSSAIVSQQNVDDTAVTVYTGQISPSSADFSMTVTMTLAENLEGDGQDGQYELVAGDVQLILISVDNNSTAGTPVQGMDSSQTQEGFGFFEWPLYSASPEDGVTGLTNYTPTYLDGVGFALFSALGGTEGLQSGSSFITAVVQHSSGILFLGGSFRISIGSGSVAANIAMFQNGSLLALADGGLNSAVTSLIISGAQLYVGGSFSDTNAGTTQGALSGVAQYDIQENEWSALQAGVDGNVTGLAISNGIIQVAGNFTKIFSAPGYETGLDAAGLATWNVSSASWVNSGGFLVGDLTFVGSSTLPPAGQQMSQLLAGNVQSIAEYGASGLVMLANGADGSTVVTPMGVLLDDTMNSSMPSVSISQRKITHNHRRSPWLPHIQISHLFARQTNVNAPAPLPSSLALEAPAVLAGAFWTNASSSEDLIIIGGNFSLPSSSSSTQSQAVAIYHPSQTTLTPLQGSQINGIVRALAVVGNLLFIGGEFTIANTSVNGFAIYDLATGQWNISTLPPLQAPSGSTVVVRSITTSSSMPNVIIIAGSFSQVGTLACPGICSWNTLLGQWSTIGDNIQGEIASVAYAGNDQNVLIAGGSIILSGNLVANVAQFSFSNTSWTAVGTSSDLPGPVTAVEVNDGNSSSIFAAGRSTDGSSAFLTFWNGVTWTNIGTSLQATTNISQLIMVPLQNTHSPNSIIESNRVLFMSGSLTDSFFGNASSALFDGATFMPYVTSISASGTPGFVSSLFYSISNFNFSAESFLATGIVILISIAISAGVVFLLALIGILWTLFTRRGAKSGPIGVGEDEDDDSTRHRPSSLLEHINAATRTTILGAQSPFNNLNPEKDDAQDDEVASVAVDPDVFGADESNYVRADTPSDAVAGALAPEETSRPAYARYSFDGTGEGELPITTGLEIEVLDDRDSAWWYARNPHTRQEGVVPAAYLY